MKPSIFLSEIVLMLKITLAAAIILSAASMNAALAGQAATQPTDQRFRQPKPLR